MVNSKVYSSLAGWNASKRCCRESSLQFYYSYIGYKTATGEHEIVAYVIQNQVEILSAIGVFLLKTNESKKVKSMKPAKRSKTALERAISIAYQTNYVLDHELLQKLDKED